MNNRDWKALGYLEGLKSPNLEIVESYFNKIDFDNLDKRIQDYAVPVVRNIIVNLIDHENKNRFIYDRQIPSQKFLDLVDIEEILGLFRVFYIQIYPFVRHHLRYIDSHAELTLLFCTNYCYMLSEKINKQDKIRWQITNML